MLSVAYPFAPVGPDAVGGAEQILFAIDKALTERGHDSMVIACEGSRVCGRLVPIPAAAGTIDRDVRDRVHAAARAAIETELPNADLVHLHGIDFPAYLPPPGPPSLATLHLPPSWYEPGSFAPGRPDTWLNCVSNTQHASCPASSALLPPIPNGVPVQELGRAQSARGDFAIMLGRICPEKGQHLALQAAHMANVPLLLAGHAFAYDTHQAYLSEQVEVLLDSRRRRVGAVGFAEKRRLLSAARCLLVPSLAPETSSLVAMEAAACGTPAIAFRVGALPEIVRHGDTGFLVDDVERMAEAIGRTSEIDSARCRAVAAENFDQARMTDAYIAAYRRLLA